VRQAAPAVLVFSLATPIGIAIGVIVNAVVTSPWVDVVAVGLASGTFILVSLVEILLPSLEIEQPGKEMGRGPRWLAFLVGVGAFAAVGYAISGSKV
jgi:zinc transporter ZupT